MAKGNMLNGTVKGRIGGTVYYVKQGEQNIVKYNKEIANPRTGRQMYQRARFSNAGRFFTRGRQNYFKFAFEGKKQSQSDFNAFMAYNINRSVLISHSALQIEGYPAIGKFIMSQGSLQPVQNRVVNDYWQAAFGVAMPEGSITTIGQLSRLLINTGNYEQGDILTFVFIWTSGSAYIPSAQPMGTANTTWHLKQFILNPTDSTPLSNYEMRAVSRAWGDQNLLTLTDLEDSQILATSYSGFCCVHSRNTRSGLKVSTQELALGESMQEAYEYAQTSEYIDSVIADWQSTGNITYSPDSILKGSLSYSASPVTGITLAEVPTSQWQLSGNTFTTDEEIYPFNLLTPAAIMGVGVVPGMFQADNIKGDAAAYVSFVQSATNQVDVHIDSTNLPSGDYEVRIYMMKGEQRIPICRIKWTSVQGIEVSVQDNGRTATIPAGQAYSENFIITPAVKLVAGDVIHVDFHLKTVGAANSWDCTCNTIPWDGSAAELNMAQVDSNIIPQGWLKYGSDSYANIENEKFTYPQIEFSNTTDTEDSYIVTITAMRIVHADGTTTSLVVV